jgi:hypothetical protein
LKNDQLAYSKRVIFISSKICEEIQQQISAVQFGCSDQKSRFIEEATEQMREIVHIQVGQCGNQIGAKVKIF